MNTSLISSKIFYSAMLIIAMPLFVIFITSFQNTETRELSISGYLELFNIVRLKEIGFISIRSLIISIVSTLLGYLLSYFLVLYTQNRFQSFFLILITLPFLANESVRVFSWQNVLSFNGIFNRIIGYSVFSSANDLNIIITMIIACLPFAIFVCTTSLKTIPVINWKVSDDLKLNQFSKFFKIALPLSKATIFGCFITVFFVSFALSSEVMFLGGDTKISVRSFVLSLMSANKFETIFAFGTFIILLLLVFYFILFKKYKRNEIS